MSTDLTTTTGVWEIDPAHSMIAFTVRHAMVAKTRGRFTDVSGTLTIDGANPSNSSADVKITASSIDTGNSDRDVHLRSGDFLDVEKFEFLTFKSTSISQVSDDEFEVAGDLTIHGVTQPVKFKAELNGVATDPFGNVRIGFEAETKINRSDFGLTWNAALEAGGVLVSDEVKIQLDVEAIKQS